jgi:GNAT superfamily N-acetyltransferase
MRIERDDSGISWAHVAALFQAVGWGARDPNEVREAFGRSTFKAFAFEGAELLGFGRTIDDGRFYATVVDVVVSPAHQGRGIGRAIVEDLQERLKGFLVVTLTAAPPVQPFYRKLGWRKLITGMIRPRSEEQARLNCPDEAEEQ